MTRLQRRTLLAEIARNEWAQATSLDEHARKRLARSPFAPEPDRESFAFRAEQAILSERAEDVRASRAWLDYQLRKAQDAGVPVDRMVPSWLVPSRIERAARYASFDYDCPDCWHLAKPNPACLCAGTGRVSDG